MKLLLQLLLIFVPLRTAASLECETCSGMGKTCSGTMETCSNDKDTCSILYTEHNLDGPLIQEVERGCDTSRRCTFPPIFFHMGRGRTYRSSWACCVGDACRNATVILPPLNIRNNGRQCPMCYAWSEKCTAVTANCTGWDTLCFEMTSLSTVNGSQVPRIMKGCTNQYVCAAINIERSRYWMSGDTVQKAECQSQASRLASLFSSTFTGLFLLKIVL